MLADWSQTPDLKWSTHLNLPVSFLFVFCCFLCFFLSDKNLIKATQEIISIISCKTFLRPATKKAKKNLLQCDYFSLCEAHLDNLEVGQGRWLTPVIPALGEAEAGRSRGQEIETMLANMVKPRLY